MRIDTSSNKRRFGLVIQVPCLGKARHRWHYAVEVDTLPARCGIQLEKAPQIMFKLERFNKNLTGKCCKTVK